MKIMKMMVLALAVLCVGTLARADGDKPAPKWSFVEAGYMDFNPDNGLNDNGWYAGGSAKIAMFHIFAEYDDIGNYTFWSAGFGWHGLLGEPADLYFQAQWNDITVDSPGGNVDNDGYEVSGGVRWKILKWLEVKGQVNWADYGDPIASNGDTSEMSGDVGVLFSILNDRLGFGADYLIANNSDSLRGYVRWSFGK